MPFAGFENFEACVLDQRGKGKSDESARRICGALQAGAEKAAKKDVKVKGAEAGTSPTDTQLQAAADSLDEKTVEILNDGDLYDILQEYAVEPPEDPNDQPVIEEIFITDDDQAVSTKDLLHQMLQKSMRGFNAERITQDMSLARAQLEVAKTAKGTTQSLAELGSSRFTSDLSGVQLVEPPYPPELLATFFEVCDIHFRCVRTKVTDSVGRDFEILPRVTVKPDEPGKKALAPGSGSDPQPDTFPGPSSADTSPRNGSNGKDVAPKTGRARTLIQKIANMAGSRLRPQTSRIQDVSQEAVEEEVRIVEDFIEDANDTLGFEGVLDRAAMDYEAIGWAAIEVIRSADKQVRRISHIPAVRMRVMKGWRGFVEIVDSAGKGLNGAGLEGGRAVYYQPFGEKVRAKVVDPLTGEPQEYDPRKHGPIDPQKLEWNLIDRETGKPTKDLKKAANEVIWIPRHHINTIYYGYTDVVPALGWLLANVHIRDYLLQFFEHNTVPRYAIIIEGARLSEPVKKAITSYFGTHVKGKAHKTLIIPIPAMRGEVRVRFERLDADAQEGSFQDTKKNNSQSIMTAHGVSPAIIGIAEAANLGSGKGLSQAEIYKDRIVTPSQRYWARKLNRLFKTGLGVQLVALKFNPLDIRDMEAEMKVLTGYMGTGNLTINQVRKKAGLGPPIPGGDRAFIILPTGIMFVDEMTEAMGDEREELEKQIEETKNQMAMKAFEAKALQATERAAAGEKKNGGSGRAGAKPPASTIGTKTGAAAGR